MGFAFGVASKVKRLLCSRQVKQKCAEESTIVNPGLEFRVTDFGSKEDMFFDTRGWLDSDCEDDYYSVNGEFTPLGTTPNRYFGPLGTPQKNGKTFEDVFSDSKSVTSPTEKKKLAELLQDSMSEQVGNEPNNNENKIEGINGNIDIENVKLNQFSSSCEEGSLKPKKEKSSLSAACCMPGLVPSMTSRKQKMSPADLKV